MSRRLVTDDVGAMVIASMRDPLRLARLTSARWERVLACARRNAVLAYLAHRAEAAGVQDALPQRQRDALVSARIAAARLAQLARWELDRVRRALAPVDVPIVALKGVAYIVRGMPHASTRLLSDIDVMVPRDRIDEAERALLDAGWQGTKLDPYDQDYYRRWSHEIPPLSYPGRLLGVDVHHTICPPVSRLRPDALALWDASEATSMEGVRVLSPADTVLHAAVHLFFDSNFDGRFRDLVDLHELLVAFGARERFWDDLVTRAREQGLGRPLYYALQTLSRVLETPIPGPAMREVAAFRPPAAIDRWMRGTLRQVLTPVDPRPWPPANRRLLWLLYVRSHWLRMPAQRLVPHLLAKAWKRMRRAEPTRTAAA